MKNNDIFKCNKCWYSGENNYGSLLCTKHPVAFMSNSFEYCMVINRLGDCKDYKNKYPIFVLIGILSLVISCLFIKYVIVG